MREIGVEGVALECADGTELHLTENSGVVNAEVWYTDTPEPWCGAQFQIPHSEMTAFIRWVLPPATHEILRAHGVAIATIG